MSGGGTRRVCHDASMTGPSAPSSVRRRFRQVDVFGVEACTGNPLAVVVDAEGLTTEQMANLSAWTNLSECTFLLPPTTPEADYRVRIFSQRNELPFAGHPTLGSAKAWLDGGGTPSRPGVLVQECGAGLVPVRVGGDRLSFAAPPLVRSGPVDQGFRDLVRRVLGVDDAQVVDTAWVDNGPGWVGVLLPDADAVLALRPDAARAPGAGHLDIGVLGPYPPGAETSYEVRAFFTDDDTGTLREDPVTGSLNASLAQWLIATGRAEAPWVAAQGTCLGRSGRVEVSTDDDEIWVGGQATVVIRGEIALA